MQDDYRIKYRTDLYGRVLCGLLSGPLMADVKGLERSMKALKVDTPEKLFAELAYKITVEAIISWEKRQ